LSFRSILGAKFQNYADFKRSTLAADGGGGGTRSWTTIYHRVPCRLNMLGSQDERVTWDQTKVMAEAILYIEHRSGLNEGDRAYLGSRAFDIRLIQNWDEAGQYLKLAVVEVRD
jgi:head-tail adaptor